jgi:NAD(P)-dependent dehydrogenase (short-subunit alcohol dehydrogenase family)
LPLSLQPRDELTGRADLLSGDGLRAAYEGKSVLVIGGTKGIGRATADVMRTAGAKVVVVGRSAAAHDLPGDLSTNTGCHALVKLLASSGTIYEYVILTVGVWPDPSDPYTSDGVHRVVQLDLVARHILLSGLDAQGLLAPSCRIMCVLASAQHLPGLGDVGAIQKRMEEAVSDTPQLQASPPRMNLFSSMRLLFTTAVVHDVWLHEFARSRPGLTFMSTFPGLLVTDLPSATLPRWVMPLYQLAMAPVADTDEIMGTNHASILASTSATKRSVSYWAAPLLEARLGHPLVQDAAFGKWVLDFVNRLMAR